MEELRATGPEIHDFMSLNEILYCLEFHESSLTMQQLDKLGRLLIRKVDAYKITRDKLEGEYNRIATYAKQHFEESKKVLKEIEKLDQRLIWAMDRNKFDKLSGDEWKVSLNIGHPLETSCDPNEKLAKELPQFVRVTHKTEYAWKKNDIKEAIEKGYVFPFGKIGKTASPNFDVNRKDY